MVCSRDSAGIPGHVESIVFVGVQENRKMLADGKRSIAERCQYRMENQEMLKKWLIATALALPISAVALECTVPEDKQLLYFVLDTAIAPDTELPLKEKLSRYVWAISYADDERDRMAKNLACVKLALYLAREGQIDSHIDKLAGCSNETIELARQREQLLTTPSLEGEQKDHLPSLRSAPEFPLDALQNGHSGIVVTVFTVDENGRVKSPKVLASSDKVFNKAALRAVRKFHYEPWQLNGKPVAMPLVISSVSMMIEGSDTYTKDLDCP